MHIELHRVQYTQRCTLGSLFIDGELFCVTLEDKVRPDGVKIFGETAIPAGIYKIILNISQRFGKIMPRLLDVPMFTGILIHSGNTDKDTKGCILLGETVSDESIHGGSKIFPIFMQKCNEALSRGEEIDIAVINGDGYVG